MIQYISRPLVTTSSRMVENIKALSYCSSHLDQIFRVQAVGFKVGSIVLPFRDLYAIAKHHTLRAKLWHFDSLSTAIENRCLAFAAYARCSGLFNVVSSCRSYLLCDTACKQTTPPLSSVIPPDPSDPFLAFAAKAKMRLDVKVNPRIVYLQRNLSMANTLFWTPETAIRPLGTSQGYRFPSYRTMGKSLMIVCNISPDLALARSSRPYTAVCRSYQSFRDH